MTTVSAPGAGEAVADPDERLFWTAMRRFEALAIDRYEATAPLLATPEKRAFVPTLAEPGGHDGLLATSELSGPIDALLATAQSPDEAATLIVQGLVLEQLAQAIYRIVRSTERDISIPSRTLAAAGLAASASTTSRVPERLAECFQTPDALWESFAERSYGVLAALDGIADPVDRIFGARFGLHFGEVMGEFTADLIGACTTLGMPRRKVVAHLAGAAMGL